ncbi:MAG: DUF92 domain-containing protein [Candidatus Eisenbacteria bacterium]|uniref:DUF92 domain-containing protein n=1 Tax=Eiseniibacteriota bacterium TaxID=2212470 RepID=A0A956NCB4_UNCEI|nr:DUF92 domain-containing protein [Candidatus Eisenbacteria bacterium]MCB9462766.1 DUF92 domain-containing protein [Candidatus Eisenbacteria bacterium]
MNLAPPAPLYLTFGLPIVLGGLALALGWVRRSAFLAGVPFGAAVLWLGGLGGFLVLLGFFLWGTAVTRLGYSAKAAKGVAEEQGGRRGSSHVLANCGAGLLVLGLRAILVRMGAADGIPEEPLLWAAFVGSFAAAASDTTSSEIGQLYGKRTVSLRTLRAVPVGTEGAVSLEGLLGGLVAAGILGVLGGVLGLLAPIGVLAVTIGGFLGNLLESLVGSWGRRMLPHGGLNFANTVVGAGLSAALLWMALRLG